MNRKVVTSLILIVAAAAILFVVFTNLSVSRVGTEKGDIAPDFTLPMYNGNEGSLSNYEGNVVIMNLWASWCDPCRREMPELMKLHQEYKDKGVTVVTVNMNSYERTQEEAEKFVKEHDMEQTPAMIDEEGEVADLYNLQLLPTTYILDENRKIVDKIAGETNFEQLENKIKEHLR
ncbi:TlpA family protein disulfide reductase [Bacillus piscicola]|uniref:TlpA family protein disulfide reductase n=1 Tax=Bacillus piscicola TaxID=1632684 RepID=UPI001F094535